MPSLFTELRRRNVFKVGAAYAIVAWLLIQVVDVVLPALQMPEWTISFVTVLLIIGFPITLIMAWAFEMTPEGIKADADVPRDSITPATGQRLNYVILGLVVLAVGFLVVDQYVLELRVAESGFDSSGTTASGSGSTVSRRSFLSLGVTVPKPLGLLDATIALSPDGRRLVYSVQRENAPIQLYLYELDQLEAQLILGTGAADVPFFSPDGDWIAFNDGEKLSKISVRGGVPRRLAGPTRGGVGGFWAPDDTIFFTFDAGGKGQLQRIAAAGGMAESLEVVSEGSALAHTWPYLLPDEDSLLFTVRPLGRNARDGRVDLLSLASGEVRPLIENAYNARYVPTGHIVFMRSATLWAVPFDLDRLELTGPEVPVIEDVQTSGGRGTTAYAFSNNGLLVYLPGGDRQGAGPETLVWVDREGVENALPLRRNYTWAVMSPDGESLAVSINDGNNEDIWIYDLERDILNPLTFDPADDTNPLWTPNGERIVYFSERGDWGLWWQAANGTGQAEPLLTGIFDDTVHPGFISPDGTWLVYEFEGDIYLLRMNDDAQEQPLIHTKFTEYAPAIDPDGRWIAYQSDQSGRFEVWVRPFPDTEAGSWRVSTDGGTFPRWSPDGQELYFRGVTGDSVWAVPVDTEADFQYDPPTMLFQGSYSDPNTRGAFDISPDGTRFLLEKPADQVNSIIESEETLLIMVDNWFEELNRLAPPSP